MRDLPDRSAVGVELYTLGCNLTFHCKCVLKYLAQLSVQQEHTYIDGATYKLDPKCPCCNAPFSVKGVQRSSAGSSSIGARSERVNARGGMEGRKGERVVLVNNDDGSYAALLVL